MLEKCKMRRNVDFNVDLLQAPRSFYGDMGVDSLIHQIEEIESNCAGENRVKFTTCMFIGRALLQRSIQSNALGIDEACVTPMEELKKQMIREFRSRKDVARAKQEFNHHSTKESGMAFYMVHFKYLVTICHELVNSKIQKNNAYLQRLGPHIRIEV